MFIIKVLAGSPLMGGPFRTSYQCSSNFESIATETIPPPSFTSAKKR